MAELELEEATIRGLQAAMAAGEVTARELAEAYIDRIERLDRQEPVLQSVLELNPDALEIASELDREREAGRTRGPLHGVPVLLKDNLATADRMETTAGSLALLGSRPTRDAFVAWQLREAGAVLLGKTNMSEWANFRSSHSSSGWSARGGQSRNPYALDRNPCGSSSAVPVAANLAAGSIGTETDGSIVCPSSVCSLVGLKPTVGLVSRSGIIPVAASQDTAGPMVRTVEDAAILLGAIAGPDPEDGATHGADMYAHADYTRFLDPDGLRGARIGVGRNLGFGKSEPADHIMEEALETMRRLGAELIDPCDLPTGKEFEAEDSEWEVLKYEFKDGLNRYLADLVESPVRTLEEVIRFNEENAYFELRYFGQDLFEQAQAKGPLTDPEYVRALERNHRLMRTEGIDAMMVQHRLDAIFAPTSGPAWLTDLINGDHGVLGSSSPAAVAGYPNITVPAGYCRGLPLGLSLFGRAWSEPVLLRLAYAYEQATKVRQPPHFLPSAALD